MNDMYRIITDLTAAMPADVVDKEQFDIVSLPFLLDGIEYTKDNAPSKETFFTKLSKGSVIKTSQASISEATKYMERALSNGKDVIYICFSSGLSGSFDSLDILKTQIATKYPERRIAMIDSLSAAQGEGIIAYKALKWQKEGKSFDEVVNGIKDIIKYTNHYFIVDDLFYLASGGRMSKLDATIGSAINIKPVLTVNSAGKLVVLHKAKGQKKAKKYIADTVAANIDLNKTDFISIGHGDDLRGATEIASLIKKRLGDNIPIKIDYLDYLCGGHTGKGCIAACCFTKEPVRKEEKTD